MYMRSQKKLKNEVFLQDPIGIDTEGNEITIEDKLSDENYSIEDEVDLKMQTKVLYKSIKDFLSPREKLIIDLRYGLSGEEELTQKEIAAMLNISRSYVSRIEKRAITKILREFLKSNNLKDI